MNSIFWLIATEYKKPEWLDYCFPERPDFHNSIKDYLEKQDKDPSKEPPRRKECLGLHWGTNGPSASCFVGQVWLDPNQKIAFRVLPRKDVDYFEMVSRCLENPTVAHYLLKNCLYFSAGDTPLPVQREQTAFPILLIVSQYLNELSLLCRRHLKRGFPRIEENLIGRCKGRILIKQNILHNTTKGRMDRLFCQFQTHSMDTPENQILKAALEQSLRFLRRHSRAHSLKALWRWATETTAFFSEVSLRRISPSDFQRIRYGGIMKAYKKPHTLARIILQALGSDPANPPARTPQVLLPPYSIDMNELFERYCELLLRKKFGNELWAGYGLTDGKGFSIDHRQKIRPDFFLTNKKWLLDAKNKYGEGKHWLKEDIGQICLYGRHNKIREKMKISSHQEELQALVLMYPDPKQALSSETIKYFDRQLDSVINMEENKYLNKIYKVLVPIPKKY